MSPSFDETFKQAVTPGPERLLAGVALAAAGSRIEEDSDYRNAFGTVQLDPASEPVTTDSVMRLASCSKLVTSIAALQCVERGILDLNSPADVERLLPEWSDPQILTGFEDGQPQLQPAKEKITLGQLLSHTSGLTYDFFPPLLTEWRKSRGEPPQALTGDYELSFPHPLIFEPGTAWAYSPGIDLAGMMVARANSCTLEEYMRKNIFGPLGMNDTSFRLQTHGDMAQRLIPMVCRLSPEAPLTDGPAPQAIPNNIAKSKDDIGGAGIFSTAGDFVKLLRSILRNDGKILKTETIDLMFKSTINPASQAALTATLATEAMAAVMTPGDIPVGTEGAPEWTHSYAGLVGLTPRKDGLKGPWVQWGGMPNLHWWIDREGGTCGIFATQLFPPGEKKHQTLTALFKNEMTRILGK
ncbi:beta-lactamase/transpeptidase-like protein [Lophiotrema nucula]|uniref:Beta-lactamase/transpeptidase-like protein n=1 Tax=Lophiotrema nucula TaxID=690887 RepID=A0A6A5ZKH7_9PLEO|nr:beta-lactamase/transpeptidase-like protein [Lophiotrema nucula]